MHGKSSSGEDDGNEQDYQEDSHDDSVPWFEKSKTEPSGRLGSIPSTAEITRLMVGWTTQTGKGSSMSIGIPTPAGTSEEAPPIDERLSADEQLGSPVLSFEEGWLVGLALGTLMILAIGRRRARRARRRSADG